uniref:Ig-like domain-containing protein n=1 Tax=Gouania willdenowi TaxID=441366 RepID=A0A8C5DY92_GOUWI
MDKCLFALAWGLLLLGGASARVVTVSPGPLIRVEGQQVSIRCDVKDYAGPREQDFDWMMSREADGQKIKIISTIETSFSNPSLSKRVASGDISVVRLQDDEAELKIAEVQLLDAGFYWCQTPSTDVVVTGNYEAQVQLTVIPNTLKVSPQTPPPAVSEGSDLTLSCNVTRELTHPTYLSVTWSVKRGAVSEEILTFGPQGDVVTGTRFARRYADGGIRLVPGQNGKFELVITRVTTSDEGIYECNGTEWTHEDGGKWIKIVESTKEMGTVGVTVKASSSSSSSSLILSPGDTLTLFCTVAADNLAALALEVSWLADGREIVTMDRSGVVISNTSNGAALAKRGEASLERTGAGEYRLSVRGVSDQDGGAYTCRTRAFVEKEGRSVGGGGRWHMAAEKMSSPQTVTVSDIKPSFTVTLQAAVTPQMASDPAELTCLVTNITQNRIIEGFLAAGTGGTARTSHLIGSLDGRGNLVSGSMYADRLKSGALSLSRVHPNTFNLRFVRIQDVDMGQFVCTVSAWSVSSPTLNVIAKRIREASVGGATFEMSCSVNAENLGEAGYSVLIQSQESLQGNVRTIMTLSPDNVLQHGGATDPNRRDNLVLTKFGPAEFRFRLAGVQLSDRGFYWCAITAWTKQQPGQMWTKATSSESNKVRINFQENGPSFSIAFHSDTSSVYPWETAKMECELSVSGSSPKTDDLAYEVSWFFTRLRGGPTTTQVASMDRFGVVKKSDRNSSSDISVERKDTHTYLLNIFGTQDSDSGEYHCIATPWYMSASTGSWIEAGELISSRVFLTVKFSLKLPLLYGSSASLGNKLSH